MSGPLIYKKGLFGGDFHPNDLIPDFFDETERAFTGGSDSFFNTGIYNTPFTKDYIYVFSKIKVTTETTTVRSYFGGRNTAGGGTGDVLFNTRTSTTNARIFARFRSDQNITPASQDANFVYNVTQVTSYRFDFVSGKIEIRKDNTLTDTITSMPTRPVEQTTRTMYLGSFNINGTATTAGLIGTVYGFFIKGSNTALSAEELNQLENYFAAI